MLHLLGSTGFQPTPRRPCRCSTRGSAAFRCCAEPFAVMGAPLDICSAGSQAYYARLAARGRAQPHRRGVRPRSGRRLPPLGHGGAARAARKPWPPGSRPTRASTTTTNANTPPTCGSWPPAADAAQVEAPSPACEADTGLPCAAPAHAAPLPHRHRRSTWSDQPAACPGATARSHAQGGHAAQLARATGPWQRWPRQACR